MAAKMSWNQAICERCWVDGPGLIEGGKVREPVRSVDLENAAQQCAYCGNPTWAGIFVRDDPKNVAYPKPKVD